MAEIIIRLQEVRKHFSSDFLRRRSDVLNGVSLEVERGETFAFLGHNGAGKTTTIKAILGLIRQSGGEIEVLGFAASRDRALVQYFESGAYGTVCPSGSIFFLPLDYASYALDRRQLTFRDKRAWLLSNKPAVAGFGAAAFLTCAVPGLNFAAMPLLVVGGTLLALRHPQPESGETA